MARCLALFLLVAGCGSLMSHWLPPSATAHLPAPALTRTSVVLMKKKGRAQGGGPKISLGRRKRKTEAEIAAAKKRSEIERAAATKKKKPVILRGRQADRYADQASGAAPGWAVYVRKAEGAALPADASEAAANPWLEVGQVSVASNAAEAARRLTHPEAALLQKRLILEHACRLHPLLQRCSSQLELGIVEPAAGDADDADGADPRPLHATPDEVRTLPLSSVELAAACGFMGKLDPNAGHYFGGSETARALESDASKVKLDKLGNDAKSAVAEQFTKTLGLRSG